MNEEEKIINLTEDDGGMNQATNDQNVDLNANIDNNVSIGFQDEPEKPKKKGKRVLIIVLSIVAILILIAVSLFVYMHNNLKADKYIDTVVADLNNSIDKAIDESKNNVNLETDDIIFNGTLKINTDVQEYASLDNLTLDFINELSLKNNYDKLNLTLKQDDNSFKGNIIAKDRTLYIDSTDLSSTKLMTELDTDIFGEIKQNSDALNALNVKDIKDFIKSLTNGIGDALKESDMSTKNKGLLMEYKYSITEENKGRVAKKLNDSINNSEYVKKLIETGNIDIDINEEDLEPMTIIVKATFSGDMEDITILDKEGKEILKKVADNKYQFVVSENEFIEMSEEKDKLTLIYTSNNQEIFKLDVTSKEKDNLDISVQVDADGTKINVNLKETLKDKNSIDINVELEEKGKKLNVSLSGTLDSGEGKVTLESVNDAKKMEELTETEAMELSNNLQNKLMKFKAFSLIDDMMSTNQDNSTNNQIGDPENTINDSEFEM